MKEDAILPGEEEIEEKWKLEKGINAETGQMWLTPRQLRAAKRLEEVWEEQDKKRR